MYAAIADAEKSRTRTGDPELGTGRLKESEKT